MTCKDNGGQYDVSHHSLLGTERWIAATHCRSSHQDRASIYIGSNLGLNLYDQWERGKICILQAKFIHQYESQEAPALLVCFSCGLYVSRPQIKDNVSGFYFGFKTKRSFTPSMSSSQSYGSSKQVRYTDIARTYICQVDTISNQLSLDDGKPTAKDTISSHDPL